MAGVSSASRGREETELLKANIAAQISRLVMQLSDLEEFKEELADDDFYAETRADTLAQLEEFKAQMTKMSEGDMSLVDEFNALQIAMEVSIKGVFKNSDVLRMFAQKQPQQLRRRFQALLRDYKLKKVAKAALKQKGIEIIVALEKLGEDLTTDEKAFKERFSVNAESLMQAVGEDGLGGRSAQALMGAAGKQIGGARRLSETEKA